MKKILVNLFFIFVVLPCNSAIQVTVNNGSNDGLGYLRNEIRKLENELELKTNKLNKCAEKNKNFQIAGIATIGLMVTGVTTNISLYSKIKDQKKMAINMNNKIKNANIQADNFMKDVEKLSQNVDYDKYVLELDSSLTDAEKQRFIEMYNNDFDLDKMYNGNVNDSNISESDKVLLGKMVRAMRNSQK